MTENWGLPDFSASIASHRKLYRAVVRQALEDAIGHTKAREAQRERARSRAWFERAGSDFRDTCALADLEPSQVQRLALELIAHVDAGHKIDLTAVFDATPPLASPKAAPRFIPSRSLPELRPRVRLRQRPNFSAQFATTRRLELNGVSRSIGEWANLLGITRTALHQRLANGWSIERALTTPRQARGTGKGMVLEHDGQRLTLKQWADRLGVRKNTLEARLMKGWTIERTLTTPIAPPRTGSGYRRRPSPQPAA